MELAPTPTSQNQEKRIWAVNAKYSSLLASVQVLIKWELLLRTHRAQMPERGCASVILRNLNAAARNGQDLEVRTGGHCTGGWSGSLSRSLACLEGRGRTVNWKSILKLLHVEVVSLGSNFTYTICSDDSNAQVYSFFFPSDLISQHFVDLQELRCHPQRTLALIRRTLFLD